jgi:hypothetical protein
MPSIPFISRSFARRWPFLPLKKPHTPLCKSHTPLARLSIILSFRPTHSLCKSLCWLGPHCA